MKDDDVGYYTRTYNHLIPLEKYHMSQEQKFIQVQITRTHRNANRTVRCVRRRTI